MTTLQEQFEKDFPDKGVREINANGEYCKSNFTDCSLDLRGYIELEELKLTNSRITSIKLSKCKQLACLILSSNNLTFVDFLNTLPNPEKLDRLQIYDNKIKPTNVTIFSKFVNLKNLQIGTTEDGLKKDKHNKFYGTFKSYQKLTKLQSICIESTDVDEGLEYLPVSLVRAIKKNTEYIKYGYIDCFPHNTNAKCKTIQDQLRPFNYELEAWQLAHPEKMVKVWKEKYQDKELLITKLQTKITQTQQELQTTKTQEVDKTKKIERLETKLKLLKETKTNLETELKKEQQEHQKTKNNFQSQLRDCLTILFPNHPNFDNLNFSDLKNEIQKIKEKEQEQTNLIQESLVKIEQASRKINSLKETKKTLTEKLESSQTGVDELERGLKEKEQLIQEQETQIQELKLTKSTIHQQTQTDFPNREKGIQTESKIENPPKGN